MQRGELAVAPSGGSPGLGYDDFKAKDKQHFDEGLRLITLRIRNGKYTAVWHPGSGAQWWASGLSYNDFKANDTYADANNDPDSYLKTMARMHDNPQTVKAGEEVTVRGVAMVDTRMILAGALPAAALALLADVVLSFVEKRLA